MSSNLATLVSVVTIAGLAMAGTQARAADHHIVWIAICGEHASRPFPLGPPMPVRDRDCPVACHAACPRKSLDEA